MGLFDGWPFKSKEQLERERRDFEKRVFPLGEAQRTMAAALLAELMSKKLKEDERMYAYISAKDKYTQEDEEERAMHLARQTLMQQKWLTDSDRLVALALVRLEIGIEGLDEYPTADRVRQEMVLLE